MKRLNNRGLATTTVVILIILLILLFVYLAGPMRKINQLAMFFTGKGDIEKFPEKYLNIIGTNPKNIDISAYAEDNWVCSKQHIGSREYNTIEINFDKELKEGDTKFVEIYVQDKNTDVLKRLVYVGLFGPISPYYWDLIDPTVCPTKKEQWVSYATHIQRVRAIGGDIRDYVIRIDQNDKKKMIIEYLYGTKMPMNIGGNFYLIRFDKSAFKSSGEKPINPNMAVLKFQT